MVGLLADLSGDQVDSQPKLRDRRFVEIDRDNFNEVMAKISLRWCQDTRCVKGKAS